MALLLMGLVIPAAALDPIFDGFDAPFTATCENKLHELAVLNYAALAGVAVDNVRSEARSRLRSIAAPLFASCACMADRIKATTTVQRKSSTEVQISLEIPQTLQWPECRPTAEASEIVVYQTLRLLQSEPPPSETQKSKRGVFTINTTTRMGGYPSLFVSRTPPPATLPRLVFRMPASGSACLPGELLCMSEPSPEMESAPAYLAKYSHILGNMAISLRRLIDQFGEEAQITDSPGNFTNFMPSGSTGQFSYAVTHMDGQPIERSTVKHLWLIFFDNLTPQAPWGFEFRPALTSVLEIEFVDDPDQLPAISGTTAQ